LPAGSNPTRPGHPGWASAARRTRCTRRRSSRPEPATNGTPRTSKSACALPARRASRAASRPRPVGRVLIPGRMRVGVIGLGIMGAPMAGNLLRAGHEVFVHGRSAARVDPLTAAGARAAASPAAVAGAVDAVVTSLPDGPDVELVVGGPDGVLAGAARGLLVV